MARPKRNVKPPKKHYEDPLEGTSKQKKPKISPPTPTESEYTTDTEQSDSELEPSQNRPQSKAKSKTTKKGTPTRSSKTNNRSLIKSSTKRQQSTARQTKRQAPKRAKRVETSDSSSYDSDSSVSQGSNSSSSDSEDEHTGMIEFDELDTPNYADSMSAPIRKLVPPRIKRRIWANKYVDFGHLLPKKSRAPKRTSYSLELKRRGVGMVPREQPQKIRNIEDWTSAFIRFVAIYTEQNPQEAPNLMKYAEIVRDLDRRQPNSMSFLFYDTQFRAMRADTPLLWERKHFELWLQAATPHHNSYNNYSSPNQNSYNQNYNQQSQSFRRRPKFNGNKFQQSRQATPLFLNNTCWGFNRDGHCKKPRCGFEMGPTNRYRVLAYTNIYKVAPRIPGNYKMFYRGTTASPIEVVCQI